jgi:RNA polymerase sigma-70 factor (ECF subfamily)
LPRELDVRSRSETRTDQDLLKGIRLNNQADFNLLYERYFRRVYSYSYLRLRNHADTEEVVQDTFAAVFRSIDAYQEKASLISWIYGIAKNSVNNHLRRAKAHAVRIERAGPELVRTAASMAACTPEEDLTLRRGAEALNDRLDSVTDWQAEVFVLRHVENLSIGKIAEQMSRSNDAVRSSLYRVKRLLTEAIDPELTRAGKSVAEGGAA